MFRRLMFTAVVVLPSLAFAASREIVELQRDVALLQEQLRTLQRSQDEKLAGLTTLVQQAVDGAQKANTSVAVLDSGIRNILRDQESKVVGPVAGVGAKMDQVTTDVQALRASVEDLNARLGRLQQQLVDLGNAVKTMQAPAAPPPAVSPAGGPAAGGAPPIPAESLWTNAMRDRSGGKSDLALQEFQDYVKYYGNTEMAPAAQYYVGEIHAAQGNLDEALKDFDTVLERWSDNPKTPDAMYRKGEILVKMGLKTKGAQEFRELINRFPSHELAAKARAQLRALGFNPPAAPAARTSAAKKRRK